MNQDPQMAAENPEAIYAQLSPEQRSAIAQEFLQEFQQSGSPLGQQFGSLNPNNITPAQLGKMHQQASKENPGILSKVMQHPIATAALGAFALHEVEKHRKEERH